MYSIHLRITLNRIAKYYKIETPQKVRYDQWSDTEDYRIHTHPYAFEITTKSREKKTIIQINFNVSLMMTIR